MFGIIRPIIKPRKRILIALICVSALILEHQFPNQLLNINRLQSFRTFTKMSALVPPQKAPKWSHTAAEIFSEADEIIRDSKLVNDQLGALSIESASIDNSLRPYANLENAQCLPVNQFSFYQHVSAQKELRDASSEVSEKLENYAIEAGLREDVYKVFTKLHQETANAKDIDPETKRYVEKVTKSFERNGLALPEEKREKVKELQKKLSNLAIKFGKNSGEQNEFLLFTKKELEGLPEKVLNQFEVVQDDGVEKLKVTFKYPDILPTLKYAKNAETRKIAFLGDQNKVPENTGIMAEAVKLRAELAELLGYGSYADYVLEERMAKTSKTVMDFINDLKVKLRPFAEKDKKVLLDLKKEEVKSSGSLENDDELYAWDSSYYSNLLLERDYQIDDQKISEYFPMESTVLKMLGIFETLFNLKFEEVSSESDQYSTWHEDVKQYAVWKFDDPSKPEFVGWLYFDIFPREGKFGHAANFDIAPNFIKDDGTKSYSVTALVCNFSKPTKTEPSLLKHSEVKTFFHELGHGIHNLIGATKYAKFSGTSVSWDFVECPSQVLEYWTWSKDQLQELSSHYQTGESLPELLIDSLISTKHVGGALFNSRQLFFSFFDMLLHTSKTGEVDLTKEWNELKQEISLLSNGETVSKGYASFGHLLGGYAAGYYGYMWSRVFAADIYYSLFKADPMNKPNGLRYRDIVLARGGTRENMDTLEELLGRKPNSEAFLQEMGLS